MWMPTGGQLEMVTYIFPPRHKENKERKRNQSRIVHIPFALYVYGLALICQSVAPFCQAENGRHDQESEQNV